MRFSFEMVTAAGALMLWASSGCAKEPAKDTAGDTVTVAAPAAPASPSGRRGPADSTVPEPAQGTKDTRPKLLIIGTSLTAGLGLDPDNAYPAILQRKLDSAGIALQVVNAGSSGETSAGALRRMDWLLRDNATVVIIETGANDGLRGQSVDSTKATLRAIVRRIKSALPNAMVLLAQMESPPNLGERYTTAFRAMFPQVAKEEGVVLMPFLLDGVAGVPSLNQADGIHPNQDGARRVAENVFRTLGPLLK